MSIIETYIPSAIKAIETHLVIQDKNENGELKYGKYAVSKEYKGYISSFGAMVLQSGLLAAIAFYTVPKDEQTARKQNSNSLLDAITYVLLENKEIPENTSLLLNYVISCNVAEKQVIEQKILNVSIALKLALRTFDVRDHDTKKSNSTPKS